MNPEDEKTSPDSSKVVPEKNNLRAETSMDSEDHTVNESGKKDSEPTFATTVIVVVVATFAGFATLAARFFYKKRQ